MFQLNVGGGKAKFLAEPVSTYHTSADTIRASEEALDKSQIA